RLFKDPQKMNFVSIDIEEQLNDAFKERYAQENSTDTFIMDPQDVEQEIERRWTALFRQVLRRSNLYETRRAMSTQRKRYGFCLGFVQKKYRTKTSAIIEESMSEEDKVVDELLGISGDPVATPLEVEVEETMEELGIKPKESTLEFEGLEFQCVSPFNILVGDLRCSEGITGLPAFTIYNRRTWRELAEYAIDYASGKGNYANVECLSPTQEQDVPSERDESVSGTIGNEYQQVSSYATL